MNDHTIGIILILAGLGVAGTGFWLARRYAAAANDASITRRHPRHHGWFGVLGVFVLVVGLAIVMVGWMIGFA